NSDPAVTFTYDQGTEGIGRLITAATGSVSSTFTYDVIGRVASQSNCLPSGCTGTLVTPAYDAAGALTSLIYPDGRKVTAAYSASGRITSANLASFGGNPVNVPYYTVPQTTASNAWGYWPSGLMNRGNFGNGVTETTTFNNRLQISSIIDSKGAT